MLLTPQEQRRYLLFAHYFFITIAGLVISFIPIIKVELWYKLSIGLSLLLTTIFVDFSLLLARRKLVNDDVTEKLEIEKPNTQDDVQNICQQCPYTMRQQEGEAHMDIIGRIAQLLAESNEIDNKICLIQAGETVGLDPDAIRSLREQYQDWYADCLVVLQEDLKTKFQKEYEGGNFTYKIKHFLASPTQLNAFRASIKDEVARNITPFWIHPYEPRFHQPLVEQQALLRQALKRLEVHPALPSNSTNLLDNEQLKEYALDQYYFHATVLKIAAPLFESGHFRQAILDVFIALNDTVKVKSGRLDLDGSKLMQQVFSKDNPTLRASNDTDEQLGVMWLFSGAVMGIRNPLAHKVTAHPSHDETLERLAFASMLFRILDSIPKA